LLREVISLTIAARAMDRDIKMKKTPNIGAVRCYYFHVDVVAR
jgi:hypothetical protein